ncbi:MAG: glycosyltransferase family 2 protein [Ardenticatenia bacterium]|nr:glycosyltransferase family 2 protein [Ardenticatenia bacterium]
MPNYNYGHFLHERIESILNQTFRDIELICIDDASSDHSRDILSHYVEHPNARVIFNATNHGSPFYSWNLGVSLAVGEFVWIAEADDLCDEDFLATMVQLMDSQESVGIAYCQSAVIDEYGNTTGSLLTWMQTFDDNRWSGGFVENGQYECRTMFCRCCEIANVSSALIRRKAYLTAGGADESSRLVGDWKLYLQILQEWDIAYTAKTLNRFRHHAGNLRSSTALNGIDIMEKYALARTMFPMLQLETVYEALARRSLLEQWFDCASRLWQRSHRYTHVTIFNLARSIDKSISQHTLSEIYSVCGFAALGACDQKTAAYWFLEAAKLNWRVLQNRGVLSVIARYPLSLRSKTQTELPDGQGRENAK